VVEDEGSLGESEGNSIFVDVDQSFWDDYGSLKFRKMSCSSATAFTFNKKSIKTKKLKSCMPENVSHLSEKNKIKKKIKFDILKKTDKKFIDKKKFKKTRKRSMSLDKAAVPIFKNSFSVKKREKSTNILEIWESTQINLFSMEEKKSNEDKFNFENYNRHKKLENLKEVEYLHEEENPVLFDITSIFKNDDITPIESTEMFKCNDNIETVRRVESCQYGLCFNDFCKNEFCLKKWKKSEEREKIKDFNFVDEKVLYEDLGKGKSVFLMKDLVYANREILRNYSSICIKANPKKKPKSKRPRDPQKKEKKQRKKPKNMTDIIQTYKKKYEMVFTHGNHHFKNRLILNPLIFQGISSEHLKPSSSRNTQDKTKKQKIPFPSKPTKSELQIKSKQNNNKHKTTTSRTHTQQNFMQTLMKARPRFAFQHRRKSSLLPHDDDAPESRRSRHCPIEISLCCAFHNNGICAEAGECLNLHGFNKRNGYGQLLRRFVNVLWAEKEKEGEDFGLDGVLNWFHSLHVPLPVFRDILFRRPETCIFDLLT
jgi:hypothetical protein